MNTTTCPVPFNQIPIREYKSLSESTFFIWPTKGKVSFYRKLFYFWLSAIPFIILILSGSNEFHKSPILFIYLSLTWSLLLPILLTFRQLLSWNYIYKRLRSENIEYEESGWYDGQIWQKTLEMRDQDLLTAQHDIKPLIKILNEAMITSGSIFIFGEVSVQIFKLIN